MSVPRLWLQETLASIKDSSSKLRTVQDIVGAETDESGVLS